MTFKLIAEYILGTLASIGILAGGVGYLYSTFKKGSSEQKNDIVNSADQLNTFWREQAEGYKAMMAEKDRVYDEKLQKLTQEVGQIRGQLIEKEKQATQYLEILQNRDPEMKKFMEIMIQAATNQNTVNAEVVRVLEDIHTTVTNEKEKNLKVTSTVTKE